MSKKIGNAFVETSLILGLIVLVSFCAYSLLGNSIKKVFTKNTYKIAEAGDSKVKNLLLAEKTNLQTTQDIPEGFTEETYDEYLDNIYENEEDLEDVLGDEAYYEHLSERYKNINSQLPNKNSQTSRLLDTRQPLQTVSQLADSIKKKENILIGTPADDVLNGSGYTHIYAQGGNDTIFGANIGTVIYGQHGNDQIYGGKRNDSIDGGIGDDKLVGGRGDDEILGYSGNDLIYGGNGKDLIDGGQGNDVIYGGKGNDTITGNNYGPFNEDEYDKMHGGKGSDTLIVTFNAEAFGGKNSDTINIALVAYMDNKISKVSGDSGADTINIDTFGATNCVFYISTGTGKDKVSYNGNISDVSFYKSSKDNYVYIIEPITNNKIIFTDLKLSRDSLYFGSEKIESIPII